MTPAAGTRVLVVDDDAPLRRALQQTLARAEYDVLTAEGRSEAFQQAAIADPAVVVLDLGLPDGDGVDLLRELRSWSDVPVLVLTGSTDPQRMLAAFEAGADDFLRKPFGLEELLARLRALLRRPRSAEAEIAVKEFAGLRIDLTARIVERDGAAVHLTPTEWRILAALVSNPGKLLTHRWLLSEVWDDGYGEETRAALRTHVRTLRTKLRDDATAPRFVATESGAGYRWIAEPVTRAVPEARRAPGAVVGPEPGAEPPMSTAHAADLVHDVNNALTAARLAVSLVLGRTARLESSGEIQPEAARTVREPLDSLGPLLTRIGDRVSDWSRLAGESDDPEAADASPGA